MEYNTEASCGLYVLLSVVIEKPGLLLQMVTFLHEITIVSVSANGDSASPFIHAFEMMFSLGVGQSALLGNKAFAWYTIFPFWLMSNRGMVQVMILFAAS